MNISLINWNIQKDGSQHMNMVDAIVCQNYNGNYMIKMLRVNEPIYYQTFNELVQFYIKCDMFLCYVQDLMKQLCIFDMQVF